MPPFHPTSMFDDETRINDEFGIVVVPTFQAFVIKCFNNLVAVESMAIPTNWLANPPNCCYIESVRRDGQNRWMCVVV